MSLPAGYTGTLTAIREFTAHARNVGDRPLCHQAGISVVDLSVALKLRALADRYCNRGELDCRWYHGNWELLKSLDIVSTSAVHAKDIADLLEIAGVDGHAGQSILLSGSTDDSLLRILATSLAEGGRLADITGLDICATPLELMKIYARQNQLRFTPVRADILEYRPERVYDAIVTHAFMGNFNDARRVQLLRKWATLLSEKGRVITIQRVRPKNSPAVIRFSAEQSKNFVDAALAAGKAGELSPAELTTIEEAARLFSENFSSHAITSRAALEQLFLEAGFRFQHLEYRSLAKRVNLAGPSVPSGGEYAFIIAQRT